MYIPQNRDDEKHFMKSFLCWYIYMEAVLDSDGIEHIPRLVIEGALVVWDGGTPRCRLSCL